MSSSSSDESIVIWPPDRAVGASGRPARAAISLAVGASDAASVKTGILLSPEEIDAATEINVGYRPPGV